MAQRVVIIGAGGHGKVVADIVRACGDAVVGFLDDEPGKENVLGPLSSARNYSDCRFVIAIGSNETRKRLADALSVRWYTAIHPTAVISPSASIGAGTVVMANAVVNAEAVIGAHCIVNTAAVVEHENVLADFVHISPNAALGGNVHVGECTHVGIGASVKNNVSICGGCTIGAGAAVVKDIDAAGIYVGVPARELK